VRVIVLPLGVIDAARVVERFPGARVEWLDRSEFRRRPLLVLVRLLRQRFDEAVLVAPDLASPRLRLTSLLLALPRARRRRRIDLLGRDEAFSLSSHLRTNGLAVVRHVLACGLALMLAYPLLSAFAWYLAHEKRRARPAVRPRRLLYLRSQLWLGLSGGGSVAHTAGVIGGLQQAGVEVLCVSSDTLAGVSAPTCIVRPECWFDGLGREAEDLFFNRPFARASLRCARARIPNVVYQRHTAFNVTGALVSRLLNIPLVLEFNSSEVWKGKHWGGLRLFGVARLVERINLRAADVVVVVSTALRDQMLADGLVEKPSRVLVNPNAVDPARFRPDLAGARIRTRLGLEWRTVVGFSGTFGVWHGIPTLAAALPRVLDARPQVRFLLIGDGWLRGLIDQVVREHGLHERVVMPGLVPLGEMPEYLAACDVLVSPHGRQVDGGEFFGSPTKVYEYMAAGRPIVASGVGQIAEALTHGQTALLVPPDDPEALAEAILRLVDDACLRARLGAAARQQAEQHHTWRGNAERLLAALERGPGRA
jgi:glycosyltransferase involved in cell wall biosynthesis